MNKRKKATTVRQSRPAGLPRAAHGARKPPAKASKSKSRAVPAEALAPSGTVVLSSDCTVAECAVLRNSLLRALPETSEITLDINAVQRIDTATMQLLTAFVLERQALGRTVKWSGAAPAFLSAARLLGLERVLTVQDRLA